MKSLREKDKRQPMTSEGKPKWDPALVDDKLAKLVTETNLDQASERRRVREAFKDVQQNIDHCLFKV